MAAVAGAAAAPAGGDFEPVVDRIGVVASDEFLVFLKTFSTNDLNAGDISSTSKDDYASRIYCDQALNMRNQNRNTLYVDFQHILKKNPQLAELIESEYFRVEPFLCAAVKKLVNHLHEQQNNAGGDDTRDSDYWISIHNLSQVETIRNLRTARLQHLTSFTGTVTRTSEVRPELLYGNFKCLECDYVAKDVEQQFKYTEPVKCGGIQCTNKQNWLLLVEESRFCDWQRVRVQENSNEIPAGSMPRTVDVILRNEAVEQAKAGDKVVFTGSLIVVPDVNAMYKGTGVRDVSANNTRGAAGQLGVRGVQGLGQRELNYKMAFLASSVQSAEAMFGTINIRDDDDTNVLESYTEAQREEIARMKDSDRLYQRLVNSIAPNVFGYDDVKRGILLMLFGGVPKKTPEGISLRGDINVCIVGDPSTSKSQFLKYVNGFLPRAVYTSGKASSAAGLTASVARDHETGEFCIEAGALMLADNGICCIDEFDKMDIKDQVAIHEAMEQQTISIAKAGIRATLNARTAILAAANPVSGRYDKSKSLKANVGLTPPIMSRFDLFFIMLDEGDETADYNIARHIVNLHQHREDAIDVDYDSAQLQRYIKFARSLKPIISEDARELLSQRYVSLRQNDNSGRRGAYRMTVRQLESMIRLSEALARLHCEDTVTVSHVKEADRLLRKSVIHVETDDVYMSGGEDDDDDEQVDDDTPADGGDDDDNDDGRLERRRTRASAAAASDDQPEQERDETETAATESTAATASASKKIKLSWAKYQQISHMLVMHLRSTEELEEQGLRQIDLIEWYLMQREDLTTPEEITEEGNLVRMVIHNLVSKDKVLLVIKEGPADDKTKRERVLIVHPNFVLE